MDIANIKRIVYVIVNHNKDHHQPTHKLHGRADWSSTRTLVQQTLKFNSVKLEYATWTLVRHILKFDKITSTVEIYYIALYTYRLFSSF